MLFFTYGIRIINQYGLCMKAWVSWDKCYAQVISLIYIVFILNKIKESGYE